MERIGTITRPGPVPAEKRTAGKISQFSLERAAGASREWTASDKAQFSWTKIGGDSWGVWWCVSSGGASEGDRNPRTDPTRPYRTESCEFSDPKIKSIGQELVEVSPLA